ncbi:hypothetical protein [Nevskia sp.]|uniref:DUF7931 domain-containing protein n=1 Tax=Nevskia sp. TaxID=1929292 RepID=UPI0025D37654|nr:hypothetical protein [Nevskia sp.]
MSDAAGVPVKLEGRAALASAALAAVATARREVMLLSFDFDRALYGAEAFVDAIKALGLSSERARIRVLINQPRAAMKGAHRFVELGRRMPSRIEFRELNEERQISHRADWLIVDERHLIERGSPDALIARQQLDAPLAARAKAKAFMELWEESPGCTEFRVLGL